MAFIEIDNVNKHYGSLQILFDVCLNIEKGDFVTLLGPSGSGKTTLLKILAGFEPIHSGSIVIDGRDISKIAPEKRNFGVVFQGYALFPHMSVFDNIAYSLRVRRLGTKQITWQVEAMLDMVCLRSFSKHKPAQLSGGQQQRVALARALVFQPSLLLLDEPMSALDKKLRIDLQDELRTIHQTLGTTFINVTHDQEEAMHMSSRIAVMNEGYIEQYDTAFELYRHPKTRFVANFIGKSNMIEGEVFFNPDGKGSFFRAGFLSWPLQQKVKTGKVIFMLRPEDIALEESPRLEAGMINLEAVVLHATYSGDRALYTVKMEGGLEMVAYGGAQRGVHSHGNRIYVCFKAEDGLILP